MARAARGLCFSCMGAVLATFHRTFQKPPCVARQVTAQGRGIQALVGQVWEVPWRGSPGPSPFNPTVTFVSKV